MADELQDEADRLRKIQRERHFQTLMLSLVLAGIVGLARIGWEMSHTMTQQGAAVESLTNSITDLKQQLQRLNDRFSNYLTRSEADVRFRSIEQAEQDHSRRLERLEDRSGGRRD